MDVTEFEDRGAYALIRINRPRQRNAMNRATRIALAQRLAQARGKFNVLVVTGSGESFCSGVDLKEQEEDRLQGRDTLREEWIEVLLAFREHPSIIIASVNGYALGGGLSLINVCDLAVAANEAQIGAPEIGFAAYPGMSGPSTQLMLPAKRAAWLVLTGRRVDGATAERWGLVNLSVPLSRLDEETGALARHVAQFNAVALAESKRALDVVPRRISDWEGAFGHGLDVNNKIRAATDAQTEGVARFAHGERNVGQSDKR